MTSEKSCLRRKCHDLEALMLNRSNDVCTSVKGSQRDVKYIKLFLKGGRKDTKFKMEVNTHAE
jgi:hypothetical protein